MLSAEDLKNFLKIYLKLSIAKALENKGGKMQSERLLIEIGPYSFIFIPMPTKKGIKPFCVSEKNVETQIFSPISGEIKRQAYAKAAVYFKKCMKNPEA